MVYINLISLLYKVKTFIEISFQLARKFFYNFFTKLRLTCHL